MKSILRILVFLWLLYWINQLVLTHGIGINPLGFVFFLFFLVVAIL